MTFNDLVMIVRNFGQRDYIEFMKKYKKALENRGSLTEEEVKQSFINQYMGVD